MPNEKMQERRGRKGYHVLELNSKLEELIKKFENNDDKNSCKTETKMKLLSNRIGTDENIIVYRGVKQQQRVRTGV